MLFSSYQKKQKNKSRFAQCLFKNQPRTESALKNKKFQKTLDHLFELSKNNLTNSKAIHSFADIISPTERHHLMPFLFNKNSDSTSL